MACPYSHHSPLDLPITACLPFRFTFVSWRCSCCSSSSGVSAGYVDWLRTNHRFCPFYLLWLLSFFSLAPSLKLAVCCSILILFITIMANTQSNDNLLNLLRLCKENFWLENVHLPPDQIQNLWSEHAAQYSSILSSSSPMSQVVPRHGIALGSSTTFKSLPMSKSLTVCCIHSLSMIHVAEQI